MTDTELLLHLITHPSPLHHFPQPKSISQISNIQPDYTQEPFEIQDDQLEAIEVLINGMTELHDENNQGLPFIQNLSQQNRWINLQSNTLQIKEQMLMESSLNESPVLNRTIDQNSQFRILVGQKCKQIEFQLSALQISKFQIIDLLITFKKWLVRYTMSQREEWEHMIERCNDQKVQIKKQYEQTVHMLQQELGSYKNKYELLVHQNQQQKQNNDQLDLQIVELSELNSKLNKQLQLIENENNELKQQLSQQYQTDSIIRQLQEEIRLLNRTIDQNSEYIFDLEQRVATQSLLIHEKEINIRNQMETRLQREREELEKQYKAEFDKMRDEIEEQIRNQLRNDADYILQSIKQQYQKEMANLQAPYLQQNEKLLEENKKLQQNVQEYYLRLKQIDGKLNTSSCTQRQLAKKIDNFHLRLKEKDVELNYYKQRLEQLELSKAHPSKTNNVMLIDDHNNSSSFIKQSAVSPCSTGTTYLPSKQLGSPRDEMINNILSRIRMKQNYSILSNMNQNSMSMESAQYKKAYTSSIKPVSPQSKILQKQKDLRMKNISFKLQQLRSDIRREIGLISN